MFVFLVFLGFLVSLSSQLEPSMPQHTSCKTLLHELGHSQSLFIFCATTKSVPVNLCVGCQSLHQDLQANYSALLANANCSAQYLDSDRINVVATTQGILTSLWQKANCDGLYLKRKRKRKAMKGPLKSFFILDCFSGQNWEHYDRLSTAFETCLNQSSPKNVCLDCKLDYLSLNEFYKEMDVASKGQVCFDLQDNMNRTRVNWSKTLNCCQRELRLTNFFIAVGVVVLLPILTFYITAIVVTKRREARHGLLNDQEPELDAPSTSALITAAVLSTRTEDPAVISARTEKLATVLNQARSSGLDDEPRSTSNPFRDTVATSESDSEEEPRLKRKTQTQPRQSDDSSDDEPLVKPKRA
ncbi:hypothetical protein KR018_007833 [Drosophila ironensis]|nr:hypothetical protein KR018_007833 [Drosophila ironensis]